MSKLEAGFRAISSWIKRLSFFGCWGKTRFATCVCLRGHRHQLTVSAVRECNGSSISWRGQLPGTPCLSPESAYNFGVSRTSKQVVIHHSSSLHECIANRRTHKLEAGSNQGFAHRIRLCRLGRHLGH